MILALGLIVTAPFAGCGQPEPKPQTVFDKIDYFVNRVDVELGRLSGTVNTLLTDIQQGVELTEDLLRDTLDELETQATKVAEQLDAAVGQISEAAARKGTSDYRKLVEIQEEILDNATTLTETVADIAAQITSAIETVKTGRAPDTTKLSVSLEAWTAKFKEIERGTQELIDRAKNLW